MASAPAKSTRTVALLAFLILCFAACGDRSTRMVDPAVKAFVDRAEQALAAGDHRSALAAADSVVARAPELPDGHFLRGRVLLDAGRYDEAHAAFEQTLAIDQEYPGGWYSLGNSAFRLRSYREALRAYEKAESTHEDEPGLWYNKGRAYARLNITDSARMHYGKALQLDSTYVDAYVWLATLSEEEGRLEEALRFRTRAFEIEPRSTTYRTDVGSLLYRTGRYGEAVELLEPVVASDDRNEGALFTLGQALLRMGREDEAQRYLDRLEAVRQEKERIQTLQREAKLHPDDPEGWLKLADALAEAGHLDAAINAHKVAVGLRPHHIPLKNNLANLYLAKGDTAEALHQYRAILRQDSTVSDVWLNLGVVYANAGRLDAAESAWRAALRHEPGHPEAQAYLQRLSAMR